MKDEFWEQPEVVGQFAAREPDHRLAELVHRFADARSRRALDLGCAAGRNTIFLASAGFDVHAVDASAAMVRRTRERLIPLLGETEAQERVRLGRMDDLASFAGGSFDLVVALGIYHNARSREEWERAIEETARVLAEGGMLLVNHFTPAVDLTGEGVRPVEGERDLYEGFPGGLVVLMEADALDTAMAAHGLWPAAPSRTVSVQLDPGRRVSVNALYRMDRSRPPGPRPR